MKTLKNIGKALLSVIIFPFGMIGGLLTGIMIAVGMIFVIPLIILGDLWGFDI